MSEIINVEEIFSSNVFTLGKMKERLPKETYEEVIEVMDGKRELSMKTAGIVAKAMRIWAEERGATHYSHWFQPLTGFTAEKHDAFVSHPDNEGRMLTEFSGKELIKGEPDASSFPSGGLRATFEARGYTAWDITSPAFLKESGCGVTLCIPTAFYSYTGEALDKKTPLLRSMEALSEQALRIVRIFGNNDATRIIPSAGAEQEYFLVDEKLFMKRADLMFAGRTLFGAHAPKGQEMEDHYFGVIKERVGGFMKDLNTELWKLGVTAKTQHNEAAPAQHELAPIYESVNIAADHNQLVMEVMKRVAVSHNLRCLLHEKPYAGVNGSGKHNNWSISTDNGVNLLEPGTSPHENVQFLLVIACIMKAVDTHADLLRQSAADVGNDLRLGADEAPPAIISMCLGEQLEDVVKQLVETGEAKRLKKGGKIQTGVTTLFDLDRDGTDRNRTSPFAFTGNKFEFRSVGSSDSIASPNTILNTIVAEAFCEAADFIEKAEDKEFAIHEIIHEYMSEHRRIIFSGDGYSEEWVKEAARRGLPNIRSTIEAASALTTDKAVKLFEKFGIFTKAELESREEITYETYAKTINIEALTMIDMAGKQIIPVCSSFAGKLGMSVNEISKAGVNPLSMKNLLIEVTGLVDEMSLSLSELKDVVSKAAGIKAAKEKAFFYKDSVVKAMENLRIPADKLEMLVDKKEWPFPTYGELMFEV